MHAYTFKFECIFYMKKLFTKIVIAQKVFGCTDNVIFIILYCT